MNRRNMQTLIYHLYDCDYVDDVDAWVDADYYFNASLTTFQCTSPANVIAHCEILFPKESEGSVGLKVLEACLDVTEDEAKLIKDGAGLGIAVECLRPQDLARRLDRYFIHNRKYTRVHEVPSGS